MLYVLCTSSLSINIVVVAVVVVVVVVVSGINIMFNNKHAVLINTGQTRHNKERQATITSIKKDSVTHDQGLVDQCVFIIYVGPKV